MPTSRPLRSDADRALAVELTEKLIGDEAAIARRRRRVARVREAIQESDYENALKLSVALDRMIDRHSPKA